jgi:protein-ribulosamine 3-kinase
MTHDDDHEHSSCGLGSVRWLSRSLRAPIEEVVSRYTGRRWRVRSATDLSDRACHPCAILSDDAFAVFVKFSEDAEASKQFAIELAGLDYLSTRAGVLIPTAMGIVSAADGTLLIMEALDAIERTPLQWRQIGKTLARIHQVKADRCGFHVDGFIGPLVQDNAPTWDWATFYGERRLWPRLRIAIASGNIPSSVVSQVEKLIQRLPELCGPDVTSSLLHGDSQQNNFISTARGTFVIDPAVYYGNPEADVALIDSFQPVPDDVFDAYREEMPLDSGFWERRNLWRVPLYLAAVALEGPVHLGRLTSALQEYLQ